tara:strand:+ start:49 stop:1041 length:993 start_codon:yes stop_codon:yes gene_type:complete
MANNSSPSTQNNSDEIDLGQLFKLIGIGFSAIFQFILRVFVYFKKNIFILIGLIIIGLAIGFGLSKITSKKLKTEVIVKPQFESKNYLYDAIDQIQANIESKDTLFFKSIGITQIDFNGLEVVINRVVEEGTTETDTKYLELLQSFENTDAIADIVRAELQNKSSFNHRITFFYKNQKSGQDFAEKVMQYLNTNEYFSEVLNIYLENALERIERDKQLLDQVDLIITNYSNKIGSQENVSGNDKIILDNKETINITGLFSLKNDLIKDIESKKLELLKNTQAIQIINFGQPQQVKKSFFSKKIVLFPFIFLALFFSSTLLKYLNKRSKDI